MSGCFHCGEPIPADADFTLDVRGERRALCCPGCLAVAALIEEQGLASFYAFRRAPNPKPSGDDDSAGAWLACDRPELAKRLTRALGPAESELRVRVDGITCAACSWLLDRGLRALDGVAEVAVNPVSGEASVRFDPGKVAISAILTAIASYGFTPRPQLRIADSDTGSEAARGELKRLAVAGLGFAQVMTLSAALYLGAFKQMDASFTTFFTLASLLVATPVVLYAGAPIFRAAWDDLGRRRLGMDTPVALAIGAALGASLFNALRGTGTVYFDSATMFVFFLTLGRFLESRARHRAGGVFDALGDLKPLCACRRRGDTLERVGTIELDVDDRVLVAPGEAVPADGTLVSAAGSFDESLLSGESTPRPRARGDAVLGGSLNLSAGPVEIAVTQIGADGYVERVGSLLGRAMADRPDFMRVADRWAAWFVAGVLAVTAASGAFWLAAAPERAFDVALATLVVTCPCALSLAAPTAFAVSLGRLARAGLLVGSTRVIERLAKVDLWLFDKTGTLTAGRVGIVGVDTCGDLDTAACRDIAAALEAGIEHPIARALGASLSSLVAERVEYVPGFGVTGSVAGTAYRLGSARHVDAPTESETAGRFVYLSAGGGRSQDGRPDPSRLVARFELADPLRPRAKAALERLAATGAEIVLVSGDAAGPVRHAARELDITELHAAQTPGDKLALLRGWQRQGRVVAAVGDGINDAPLLAQADVSIAMVDGSQLARASADVVFTGDDLGVLARLPDWAAATRRVVRENLAWAVVYNLTAVPLAAAGILSPWMAALGMSLSSLVVVANALKLNRALDARTHRADHGTGLRSLSEQAAA